jgi:hypothetical protein
VDAEAYVLVIPAEMIFSSGEGNVVGDVEAANP